MSWFRLDDKSWSHAKIIAAGNAAWGAFCRLGAYAADHLTDGAIPSSIAQLVASIDETEKLVAVGLLTREPDGSYRLHDYLRYNPKARDVKKKRDEVSRARSQAGRIGGKRSAQAREASPKQTGKQTTKQTSEPLLKQNEAPDPVPSRPVPKEDQDQEPSAKAAGSDPVRIVFRYYADQRAFALGATSTTKPTPKRLQLIRNRLKEGFTVEDLKRAVDGLFMTPFNLGDNDRHTKFVDLEHVFREAKQVERHRATADEKQSASKADAPSRQEPRDIVTDPAELARIRQQIDQNLDAVRRQNAPFLFDEEPKKPEATP